MAYRLLGLQKRVRPVMMSENEPRKVYYVYIAGYPCPSYSNLGKGAGVQDRRGLLTLKGLEYVALRRPKLVVFEQVSSILQKKHSEVWNYVLKTLKTLDYVVDFKVCDTKQFAVPQSRSRVYLLAIAAEVCRDGTVAEPQPKNPVDLHFFLRKDVAGSEKLELPKYERLLGQKLWTKGYVLDVGASEGFQSVMTNCCPCLTKTRLGQDGYYIPKLRRRLLTSEAASLQGLPSQVLNAMQSAAIEHDLPSRTIEKSLGDAMSINVLASVVMTGLWKAGLASSLKGKKAGDTDWMLETNGEVAAQISDKLFANTM